MLNNNQILIKMELKIYDSSKDGVYALESEPLTKNQITEL